LLIIFTTPPPASSIREVTQPAIDGNAASHINRGNSGVC